MGYVLMLLGDPGTERARVLSALRTAPDIQPEGQTETRYRLRTPHGEAELNFGTKDPVESVHVEFALDDPALMEAVTHRSLALARALEMYVEDVQWGHEVTEESLPRLREYWRELRGRSPAVVAPPARPWWRFW